MKIQNSIRFALAALVAGVFFNTIAFGQEKHRRQTPPAETAAARLRTMRR